MDTGMKAKVWFTDDDFPCMRKVYCDGRGWLVRDRYDKALVPIDAAMGWVLVIDEQPGGCDDCKAV